MKNYLSIALALLLGTLLAACVGCAPPSEQMKPTHTVTLFDGRGNVIKKFNTNWYSMAGSYVNFIDSDTGEMVRVRDVAMVVAPVQEAKDR